MDYRKPGFEELIRLQETCSETFSKEPYKKYFRGTAIGRECLRVHFTKDLPSDVALPTEYEGVRVEPVIMGLYGNPLN